MQELLHQSVTGAPPPVEELRRLEEIAAAARLIAEAEVHQLQQVYAWALAHPASGDQAPLTHDEHPGGEGTPAVAAFTAEPLGVTLRVSTDAAQALVADALDLHHRLPRVLDETCALLLPVWKARRIARATRHLSLQAAHWVDRQLLGRAASVGPAALDRLIATAVAQADPETTRDRESAAKQRWGVSLTHPAGADFTGTSELRAIGDTLDLTRFHDLVCAEAEVLGALGDTDPLGARQAKALGVIAAQQATLDLLGAAPAPERRAALQRRNAKTRLYLHASLADLAQAESTAVGSVERLGACTLGRIKDWVGHSSVTIVPVLDLAGSAFTDRHDPPPRMAEQVVIRDQVCVFPWCTRDARRADLDHIEEYDDTGPPDQTRPTNLAPLCRRHHRAKTTRAWDYSRQPDGSYLWASPQGTAVLVTDRGTIAAR